MLRRGGLAPRRRRLVFLSITRCSDICRRRRPIWSLAGLRLGIIGQTEGQRIVAALEPVIRAAVAGALTCGPDGFGSATFAVELASMDHETQYTRLFRS